VVWNFGAGCFWFGLSIWQSPGGKKKPGMSGKKKICVRKKKMFGGEKKKKSQFHKKIHKKKKNQAGVLGFGPFDGWVPLPVFQNFWVGGGACGRGVPCESKALTGVSFNSSRVLKAPEQRLRR